jgi:DNA-directed RNA polymerase subunit M/transcription elongation factor TFIIS
MADSIVIVCPNCKKQLKGPADLQGKKIRCKACGYTFAASAQGKAASAATAKSAKTPAKQSASPKPGQSAKPAASAATKSANAPAAPDDIPIKLKESFVGAPSPAEAAPNPPDLSQSQIAGPYRLTSESEGVKRCPQCAFEMEEEAVICLQCGFNTKTRTRLATVRTFETTSTERLVWLMPGILCAVAVLLAIANIVFFWLVLPGLAQGDWWGHFSIQVWGSIIMAFIGYFCGRFAFKRLILHPHPPEKEK